jgi:hypothetical protein
LSVSGATFPNPTLVMHVMVKYRAVTYIVCRGGPSINSARKLELPAFDKENGCFFCEIENSIFVEYKEQFNRTKREEEIKVHFLSRQENGMY